MKLRLITSSLLALVGATLIGCGGGGGSDGVTTSSTSSSVATPAIATAGSTDAGALPVAAMANLSLAGSVQGVAINSPPVITFQLINSDNNTALTGLDKWWVQKSADPAKTYTNFAFSIAKLVPGTNGSPSKWVSYMVSTPVIDKATGNITSYTASAPGSENNGVLEYIGNGQYKYTFRRDIKQVAQQVKDAVIADANKLTQDKADLGDLTYDPNAIHRLVIQISGAVRGAKTSATSTTCNTETGVCDTSGPGANFDFIRTPVDLVYDWIPATGRAIKVSDTDVEQREIVNVAACASCHNKFTFHSGGNALKGWAGGRQETRQCMVCHTDQRKFGSTGSKDTKYLDAIAKMAFNNVTVTNGVTTYGNTPTISGLDASDRHSNLDFPVFIHKMHMGEELTRTGYMVGGINLNETKYPQLITNCAKCHSGETTKPDGSDNVVTKLDGTTVAMKTAQGNNWFNKPNRLACGACHDGINFNTGEGTTLAGATSGHGAGGVGGKQADDSMCSTCHNPAAIKQVHVAVTPQDKASTLFVGGTNGNTNAAWLASNPNNLPEGAIKVTYDIKSVSRNASRQPVMVFRMLQNSVAVDFNAKPAAGATDAVLRTSEMWPNFMGAPSAYFVFAVPQDGISAPADFNGSASGYLRSIWNGKATGTLTGPDVPGGYYTVTLTAVTIPDDAVMLTGGLGYTYAPANTMPLTQTNLKAYPVAPVKDADLATVAGQIGSSYGAYQPNATGGLIVVAPDLQKVGSAGATTPGTGPAYSGRRAIVEDKRCNNCHQELGAFNASQFHAGQRNDGSTCSWCHNPNRASSGWSADSTNFIHGIHGAIKRTNKFTWHAASTLDGFWSIGYPGVLKNCEACHLPGSYDFSNGASQSAAGLVNGIPTNQDKRLFRYAATGVFNTTALPGGTPAKTPTWTFVKAAGGNPASCTVGTSAAVATDVASFSVSPFVLNYDAAQYGYGFQFSTGAASGTCDPNTGLPVAVPLGTNASTGLAQVLQSSPNSLLETPTATVCFACHDDKDNAKPNIKNVSAKQHMLDNGAKIYAARGGDQTTPPAQTETCLTCHGPTSVANIKAAHSK